METSNNRNTHGNHGSPHLSRAVQSNSGVLPPTSFVDAPPTAAAGPVTTNSANNKDKSAAINDTQHQPAAYPSAVEDAMLGGIPQYDPIPENTPSLLGEAKKKKKARLHHGSGGGQVATDRRRRSVGGGGRGVMSSSLEQRVSVSGDGDGDEGAGGSFSGSSVDDAMMAELDMLERMRDNGVLYPPSAATESFPVGGGGLRRGDLNKMTEGNPQQQLLNNSGGGNAVNGAAPIVEVIESGGNTNANANNGTAVANNNNNHTMSNTTAMSMSINTTGGGIGGEINTTTAIASPTAAEVQYLKITVEVLLTCLRISVDCFISHDWDTAVGMMAVVVPSGGGVNNNNNNGSYSIPSPMNHKGGGGGGGGAGGFHHSIHGNPFSSVNESSSGGGGAMLMSNSHNNAAAASISNPTMGGGTTTTTTNNTTMSNSQHHSGGAGGGSNAVGLHPASPSISFSGGGGGGALTQLNANAFTAVPPTITHVMPDFVETLSRASLEAMHSLYATVPRQGCKLVSIDGEKVSTSADIRQILLRHHDEQDYIVIGFVQFYTLQQRLALQQQQQLQQQTSNPFFSATNNLSVSGGGGGVANNNNNSVSGGTVSVSNGNASSASPNALHSNSHEKDDSTPAAAAAATTTTTTGANDSSNNANNNSNSNAMKDASSQSHVMYGIQSPLAQKHASSSNSVGILAVEGGGGGGEKAAALGPLGPALPVVMNTLGGAASNTGNTNTGGGGPTPSPPLSHQQQRGSSVSLGIGDLSPTAPGIIGGGGGGVGGGGASVGRSGAGSSVLRSSFAEGDASQQFDRTPMEVFSNAIDRVRPGKCIILLHHQPPPPLRLVEEVARIRGVHVTLMDMGITIHRRPRHEQTKTAMRTALDLGDWLVINNATKSMATMQCLEEVIEELQASYAAMGLLDPSPLSHRNSNTAMAANASSSQQQQQLMLNLSTDPNTAAMSWAQRSARIIIIAEPHPHFPKALLSAGNIVFRHCDVRGDGAEQSRETLRESMARLKLLKASQAMLSTSQAANDLPGMRKVRISSNVDVVSYDQSADHSMLVEEGGMGSLNGGAGAGGAVAPEVRPECVSLQGEQFTCLEEAGDGRIAAGSSGGNVYIYSVKGQSLLTFHAHQCTVWGLDFRGHHEFVLGSEDACLSHWHHDLYSNVTGYRGQIVTRFSSDVLAVKYADPLRSDVVVAGGLNGSLCLVNVSTGKRLVVPTVSTILCLSRVPYAPNQMLMGGGTGLVTVWDCDRGVPSGSFFHHRQKVSCVAAHNGMLLSSSFDGSVVIADIRVKNIACRLSPGGSQGGPVTCFAQKGNTLAVAAEDSLCVYDLRKPPQLLHRRQNAWHSGHFARGLQLDDTEGYPIAIAASSDGILRFFGCV